MMCFCCGSEITAPQFHAGKAYGWTCIKKVVPSYKRRKNDFSYVQAERVEDVSEQERRALINGKWYAETRFSPQMPYRYIHESGIVQVTTYKYGTKVLVPVWKGLN